MKKRPRRFRITTVSIIYMKIICPICKNSTTWEENPWRPFCSERCKLIDLGKWVLEEYRIEKKKEEEKKKEKKE